MVDPDKLPHSEAAAQLIAQTNAILNGRSNAELTRDADKYSPGRIPVEERHTVPDPVDVPSRAELDAKLAAAEAKTEARLATFQGEVRVGFGEIRAELRTLAEGQTRLLSEQRSSRQWIIGTILVVAAIAFAGALADRANILASFQAGIAAAVAQHPQQEQPNPKH